MLSLYFTTPKVPRILRNLAIREHLDFLAACDHLPLLTVRLSSSSSVRLIGLSRELMLILPE